MQMWFAPEREFVWHGSASPPETRFRTWLSVAESAPPHTRGPLGPPRVTHADPLPPAAPSLSQPRPRPRLRSSGFAPHARWGSSASGSSLRRRSRMPYTPPWPPLPPCHPSWAAAVASGCCGRGEASGCAGAGGVRPRAHRPQQVCRPCAMRRGQMSSNPRRDYIIPPMHS